MTGDACAWLLRLSRRRNIGRTSSRSDISGASAESVNTNYAIVDVVIRGRPEGVVGVRVERVVQEIVIGIGPEQRSDETNDNDRPEATMMVPGKLREATAESRVRQGGSVSEERIA